MDFNEDKKNTSERAGPLLAAQKKESPGCDELIQSLIKNQATMIHGTQDFFDRATILGFRTRQKHGNQIREVTLHLIRDQDGFDIKLNCREITKNNKTYLIKENANPPLIDEQWGLKHLQDAINEPSYPDDIQEIIDKALKEYLDFQNELEYEIIIIWIIATYFTPMFDAFPFINALGPKESGKTKFFELLVLLVFYGKKVKNITEAALADTMDCERGTLLIDQAEKIKPELIGFLADSYKKEGAKRRIVRYVRGVRQVHEYSGYGAKGFASTKPLDDDLSDRCIQINMLKTQRKLPDINQDDDIWIQIRDACYRFMFCTYNDVKVAYESIPGNGTRKMELWRPLGAIAQVLGMTQEKQDKIRIEFMKLLSKTQAKPSRNDTALLLTLKTLAENNLKHAHFSSSPKDILDRMENYIDESERPRPQWVGKRLSTYNLLSPELRDKSTTGARLMDYYFNTQHVLNVVNRYI